MRFATFISLIGSLTRLGAAWDPDAHRIVARIAANLISHDSTEKMIKEILAEGSKQSESRTLEAMMAQVAPFADHHSAVVNKSFKNYHFVSVPDRNCSGVDLVRDCGDEGCILSGIPRFAKEVADTTLSLSQRSLALKYLIHLVADLHQPMHIGFKSDHGGVGVTVHLPGHRHKHHLHQIWDRLMRTSNGLENLDTKAHADLLLKRIQTSRRNARRQIRKRAGSFIAQDGKSLTLSKLTDLTLDMANETLQELTCKFAYSSGTDLSGKPIWIQTRGYLDQKYFDSRSHLVDLQLIRAGVRLAYILEVIDRYISVQGDRKLGIVTSESGMFESIESPNGILGNLASDRFFSSDQENTDPNLPDTFFG